MSEQSSIGEIMGKLQSQKEAADASANLATENAISKKRKKDEHLAALKNIAGRFAVWAIDNDIPLNFKNKRTVEEQGFFEALRGKEPRVYTMGNDGWIIAQREMLHDGAYGTDAWSTEYLGVNTDGTVLDLAPLTRHSGDVKQYGGRSSYQDSKNMSIARFKVEDVHARIAGICLATGLEWGAKE